MKKLNKKYLVVLSLLCAFLFCTNISSAQENDELTSHRTSYEIYDEFGNLVSSGILPMSESEALSRKYSYPAATLVNGQTMYLKEPSTKRPFHILPSTTMKLNFALDKTSSMRVSFWDTYSSTYITTPWQGLTGGLSTSCTTPNNRDSFVQVEIKNFSSHTVTVLWATLDF